MRATHRERVAKKMSWESTRMRRLSMRLRLSVRKRRAARDEATTRQPNRRQIE